MNCKLQNKKQRRTTSSKTKVKPTKPKGYSENTDYFYYNTSTDEQEAIQSLGSISEGLTEASFYSEFN